MNNVKELLKLSEKEILKRLKEAEGDTESYHVIYDALMLKHLKDNDLKFFNKMKRLGNPDDFWFA